MGIKLQIRNDSNENWLSVNPILDLGEIGYDTTVGKIKIGDGSTAWNKLEYLKGEKYNDAQLIKEINDIKAKVALKADKTELTPLATKEELTPLATKEEVALKADKTELTPLATKEELTPLATKEELTPLATKEEVALKADKTELTEKVNVQQGTENNGKVLGIGSDGNVLPVEIAPSIDESNLVHKTGDEVITGKKTFNDTIELDTVSDTTVVVNDGLTVKWDTVKPTYVYKNNNIDWNTKYAQFHVAEANADGICQNTIITYDMPMNETISAHTVYQNEFIYAASPRNTESYFMSIPDDETFGPGVKQGFEIIKFPTNVTLQWTNTSSDNPITKMDFSESGIEFTNIFGGEGAIKSKDVKVDSNLGIIGSKNLQGSLEKIDKKFVDMQADINNRATKTYVDNLVGNINTVLDRINGEVI